MKPSSTQIQPQWPTHCLSWKCCQQMFSVVQRDTQSCCPLLESSTSKGWPSFPWSHAQAVQVHYHLMHTLLGCCKESQLKSTFLALVYPVQWLSYCDSVAQLLPLCLIPAPSHVWSWRALSAKVTSFTHDWYSLLTTLFTVVSIYRLVYELSSQVHFKISLSHYRANV